MEPSLRHRNNVVEMRIDMGLDKMNMTEQRIGVELGSLVAVQGHFRIEAIYKMRDKNNRLNRTQNMLTRLK